MICIQPFFLFLNEGKNPKDLKQITDVAKYPIKNKRRREKLPGALGMIQMFKAGDISIKW